jgi:hypothetical protein
VQLVNEQPFTQSLASPTTSEDVAHPAAAPNVSQSACVGDGPLHPAPQHGPHCAPMSVHPAGNGPLVAASAQGLVVCVLLQATTHEKAAQTAQTVKTRRPRICSCYRLP